MRVLFSLHADLRLEAGAPKVTTQLAAALTDLGHEVAFFSFADLPHRLPGKFKDLAFPFFTRRHLSQHGFDARWDVIDASTGDAWAWAVTHKQPRRPRLITRSHGLEHTVVREARNEIKLAGGSPSWRFWLYHERYRLFEVAVSLRLADATLFLNRLDREYAVSRLGLDSSTAHVIHNGVLPALLALPPPVTNPDDGLQIACIWRFEQRKGMRYAVEALSAFLQDSSNASVTFLGSGASGDTVLNAFPPPLRPRISVIPGYRQTDLPTLLEGHQVKLMPTLAEGFSGALLEAMACGLAPITTATAGPLEIVVHGQNGLIVLPRDAHALHEGLRLLDRDRNLLARLRTHAHSTAQQFDWHRIAQETVVVYETALGNG